MYKVLNFLTQSTVVPFLVILEKWLFYGILEDLHSEFFVEEKTSVKFNERTEIKYEENYWNDKYALNQSKVPCFLENIATKIFLTGKYVNVIKVYDPKREFEKRINLSSEYVFTLHNDEIRTCVDRTFEVANQLLIKIIMESEKFVAILKSIKKYFFMELGDYFLNFLDLAENELAKNAKLVSADKLANFLEIAVKTSSAASDVYHERLSCSLTPFTTFEVLQAFNHYNNLKENKKLELDNQNSVSSFYASKKGFETLTLNYKIQWPLNLILTEQTLFKYQLLFRYLFFLKYPERQLSLTWQVFMEQRDLSGNLFFKRAMATLQKMIHFNKAIIYHFLVDVVNKKWEEFMAALQNDLQTFEKIITLHDHFLHSIFQESLMLEGKFKAELYSLNNFMLFFCDNMRNLIGDCVNYDYKNILVN